MKLTIEDENGYQIRAEREDIGTFTVVAVEWKHPNWSYFSDGMIWINSLHLGRWIPIAVSKCSRKYHTLDEFLEDFPHFSPLFSDI